MTKQYDNLDTRTKKGREAPAALKVKINETTASITKQEQATGRFQRQVGNYSKALGGLKQGFEALIGPLGAVAIAQKALQFGKEAVTAADLRLKAEAKLLTALKGRRDVQQRIIKQAEILQDRLGIDQDIIKEQQAYLAALGLTEDQILATTVAALDFAEGANKTLEESFRELGKTLIGNRGELNESIKGFSDLTKEQLKAGEGVRLAGKQFEGLAKAAADAGTGGLKTLELTLKNIKTEIGEGIVPFINDFSNVINRGLVPAIKSVNEILGGASGGLLSIITDLNEKFPFTKRVWFLKESFWDGLGGQIWRNITGFGVLGRLMGGLSDAVGTGGGSGSLSNIPFLSVNQDAGPTGADLLSFGVLEALIPDPEDKPTVSAAAKRMAKFLRKAREELAKQTESGLGDSHTGVNGIETLVAGIDPVTGQPTDAMMNALQSRLDVVQSFFNKESDAFNKTLIEDGLLKGLEKFEAVSGATFDTISSLFEVSKQRELKAAAGNTQQIEEINRKYAKKQQGFAILEALINTATGITRTIRTLGMPLAIPFVAAAAAMGAAQVATISAQQFAQGGIINGPSHARGGVPYYSPTGNVELEGGELVVNKGIHARPDFVNAISAMNAMTGGKAFADGGIIDGGFSSRQITNGFDVESIVRATMANMPPIYVAMKDFKDAEGNYISTVQGGNL